MAKYRHRIFEMYEFRDEAVAALTVRTSSPVSNDLKSWTYKYLKFDESEGVTHVTFKNAQAFEEENTNDLRVDFLQLADRLANGSKVLLDFTGITSVCDASIEVLALFKQKLRTKGSSVALCCLEPAPRESFFEARSPN